MEGKTTVNKIVFQSIITITKGITEKAPYAIIGWLTSRRDIELPYSSNV